jgi:hypothetical protein
LMVSFAFDFQQDNWVFTSARLKSDGRIVSSIPPDAPAQNPKAGQFPSEPFGGLSGNHGNPFPGRSRFGIGGK